MDLFHRVQEPEDRELTWIKPFDNRMDEILRLKEKSETCPKEMKKVFLSAWGELATLVKSHQKIAAQIVSSGLPLKVYYNVTLKTDMAAMSSAFIIIADEIIMTVLFKKKEHIEWDRYDTRFSRMPEAVDTRESEEAACVLADWLQVNRAISGKEVSRVVPILIDEEETEYSASARPIGSSEIYTGITQAIHLHPDVFGQWLVANCAESEMPTFTSARCNRIIEAIDRVIS